MTTTQQQNRIGTEPFSWINNRNNTPIARFYTVNFNNAWCGDTQTIDVYCSNNQSKKCEQKTTSMDFNGDNDSLVFNCNICNLFGGNIIK